MHVVGECSVKRRLRPLARQHVSPPGVPVEPQITSNGVLEGKTDLANEVVVAAGITQLAVICEEWTKPGSDCNDYEWWGLRPLSRK
jgi:hypothetical protein